MYYIWTNTFVMLPLSNSIEDAIYQTFGDTRGTTWVYQVRVSYLNTSTDNVFTFYVKYFESYFGKQQRNVFF